MATPSILWVREDLRVADNPALTAALAGGGEVVALYVEATDPSLRPRGAASRWWLHQSLQSLAADLAAIRVPLETRRGSTAAVIAEAVARHKPGAVHWNRRYDPAGRAIDTAIKATLRQNGIGAESHIGNVLVEPFDIATKSGTPFAVFTPFWKAVRERQIIAPFTAPRGRRSMPTQAIAAGYVEPFWARKFRTHWQIGEEAARERLAVFMDELVAGYADGRDMLSKNVTSRLSPHLAFGEISARQIWSFAQHVAAKKPELAAPIEKFLSELAWRDFYIHQLYHRDDIATASMQRKFDGLAWRDAPDDLIAWQKGETGIAVVDAGMRELWETGFMHNRVRMITASFLTKNLLIDWREGERWFWDCLVDADPASNPGNWQWVAGCGNDAAPYFRIFNPETQAEKFDPDGAYVRRWAPAPRRPIVDLKSSRERALAAFAVL